MKDTCSRSSVAERDSLKVCDEGSIPFGCANKKMRIVMFWENGAYVSTLSKDFDKLKKELFEQYGPSCFATVRFLDE